MIRCHNIGYVKLNGKQRPCYRRPSIKRRVGLEMTLLYDERGGHDRDYFVLQRQTVRPNYDAACPLL